MDATPEELNDINDQWEKSFAVPIMTFNADPTIPDPGFVARKRVLNMIHALAVSKGCDPNERWGIHFGTGEFIAMGK